MTLVLEIIYGIFFIALGYGMIRYRRTVKGWTGNFYWAEKYLGNGGTYLVLLMIGLALIAFGASYPFGGSELLLKK